MFVITENIMKDPVLIHQFYM